jgi:RNA polymerase sigma-70 factor (ECF subfamily)
VSDTELARRCLRGDASAYRELVECYESDVMTLCVRLLRHHQDAEDVAQETFLRVFRSLHRWDQQRPLRPWIMAIAVNRCRTCIERRGRFHHPLPCAEDIPARRESSPPIELASGLHTAVDALRNDYREVFVLYHEQGQSYEQISAITGRPVGTIKTWLHRARLAIHHHLHRIGLVTTELAPKPVRS